MKTIFLLCLLTISLLASSLAKTYIPTNAITYIPLVYKETKLVIDDKVTKSIFPSLIEQESCVRLKGTGYWARRCWSPISELKNSREQGVGFGQITRAWNKSGTLRFDTLRNLKRKYPKELKDLTWDNIKEEPELQIRAMLLLWNSNFKTFSKTIPIDARTAFTDSSYNGGFKYLNRERKECKLRKNCNPKKWFKNTELMKSSRAKRKLYGNKSAWDINREHVYNVLKLRHGKYEDYYKINFNDDIVYQTYDDGVRMMFYGE